MLVDPFCVFFIHFWGISLCVIYFDGQRCENAPKDDSDQRPAGKAPICQSKNAAFPVNDFNNFSNFIGSESLLFLRCAITLIHSYKKYNYLTMVFKSFLDTNGLLISMDNVSGGLKKLHRSVLKLVKLKLHVLMFLLKKPIL